MKEKFAAQLYTVREELKEDFPGVLREIAKMGWAGVQISGLHGYAPEDIARVLEETGLKTAGMHVALGLLTEDLDEVMRQARLFGTVDLVCPSIPKELQTEDGFRQVRATLNHVAKQVEPQGFRVSYHNHAFEFSTMVEGKDALTYLLEPTVENRVLAEIDTYWVKKGGRDPYAFVQSYANRMPIIHLKDMTDDEHQMFAAVGTGSIDFLPILRWCEQAGVEWYAVEQDVCPGNPLDSLAQSLQNLQKYARALPS